VIYGERRVKVGELAAEASDYMHGALIPVDGG